MTQPPPPYPYPPYPSPYAPPQPMPYYGQAPDQLLAPARRAAMLMFVLGGLITLLGFCNGAQALVVNADELVKAQERFAVPGAPASPFTTPESFRIVALVCAALTLVVGMTYIGLGTAVRRGSRGASIGAIVISVIIGVFCVIMALGSTIMAFAAPLLAICACGSVIPLGMLVLLTVWLVQSLRAAANWKLSQAQYLAQYWQYQQAQAQGLAAGYGYGAPQAPPAAPGDVDPRNPG